MAHRENVVDQVGVERLLQAGVAVQNLAVTLLGRPLLGRADDVTAGVYVNRAGSRRTAQVLLVEILKPGLAVGRRGGVTRGGIRVDLRSRDGTDVTEQLRGRGSPEGVRTPRHALHTHTGEFARVQLDELHHRRGCVRQHRRRLELVILLVREVTLDLFDTL